VHCLGQGPRPRQGAAAVIRTGTSRGHGASGPARRRSKYIDQLDDDLADLSSWIPRHDILGQALPIGGFFPPPAGLALRDGRRVPRGRPVRRLRVAGPISGSPLRRPNRPGAEDGPQVSMPRIVAPHGIEQPGYPERGGTDGGALRGQSSGSVSPTTPSYSYRLARSLQAPLGLTSCNSHESANRSPSSWGAPMNKCCRTSTAPLLAGSGPTRFTRDHRFPESPTSA